MTTNACPACRGPVIAHTDLCVACGPPPVPRLRRRTVAEVSEAGAADRAQLTALVGALTGEPLDIVEAVIARDDFGLELDATDEQKTRLVTALSAARARCSLSDQVAPDTGTSVHWSPARPLPEKLAATAAIGVATLAFGVPLVPSAALLTAAYIVVRAVKLVPHRLAVLRDVAERRLLLVDDATFAEVYRAARGVTDAGVRDALRRIVDAAAEVLWLFRSEGAHLHNAEVACLDDELIEVLRGSLVLAAGADRLMPAAGGYRRRDPGELSRRLAEVEGGLDRVRNLLGQMHGAHTHAPAEALAGVRSALQDLRLRVGDANEMARPPRA